MVATALLIGQLLAAGAQEECAHPAIMPVVQVGDWFDPSPTSSLPGQPPGDSLCDLYCGIEVQQPTDHIPMCSSYSCAFELVGPAGFRESKDISFGPRYDGMTEPTGVGGICNLWKPWFPVGPYTAKLSCSDDPAITTEVHFIVAHSRNAGFDLPESSWQDTNRCPTRPIEGVTPNPSLQRTEPGPSPGFCR